MEVAVVHQRIIMNNDLLQAAKSGDETSFAELLGLGVDNGVQGQQSEITIDPSNDRHIPKPIAAIDEPDFFLGVTPAGNSLLHITANSGFLNTTKKLLHKEKYILKARNKTQETPLHCAARSGSDDIVSYLIDFAREMEEGHEVVMEEVLRARNEDGETALHGAARHNREDVARTLISADPGLTSVVDKIGISPLYLAAALGHLKVVQVMIEGLKGTEVSTAAYAGPRRQTVLHVAVLRSKGMTEELLTWKPFLAQMPDDTGSTPLHIAASYGYDKIVRVLLEYDNSLAYRCDYSGSYPLHVAAKTGHVHVIKVIMDHCPDSDELLDDKRRNFLHVAVQERRVGAAKLVTRTTSKHIRLKNSRDVDGNTPLHLAFESGDEIMIRLLMEDKEVSLNIFNKKGLTPRDQAAIASFKDKAIFPHDQPMRFWIRKSLRMMGAYKGISSRRDQFVADHTPTDDEEKEHKKLAQAIQTIGLGSVLIATATFAAAFTMPGGYHTYDDPESGSPILTDAHAFKAFVMLDSIAFLLAFHSTIMLLFRGVTSANYRLKKQYVSLALSLIIVASRCTVLSFALAIYVVLAPAYKMLGLLVIAGGLVFQYDGNIRQQNFLVGVIGGRPRDERQLWQNKVPEVALRSGSQVLVEFVLSIISYYVVVLAPILIAALGPLIFDGVWDIFVNLLLKI